MRSFTKKALVLLVLLSISSVSDGTEELPKIGLIDFYGIRTVSQETLLEHLDVKRGEPIPVDLGPSQLRAEEIRKLLELSEGSPVPANQREIEQKLESVKGVTKARLHNVCCEPDGTATLFVGIQEKNA